MPRCCSRRFERGRRSRWSTPLPSPAALDFRAPAGTVDRRRWGGCCRLRSRRRRSLSARTVPALAVDVAAPQRPGGRRDVPVEQLEYTTRPSRAATGSKCMSPAHPGRHRSRGWSATRSTGSARRPPRRGPCPKLPSHCRWPAGAWRIEHSPGSSAFGDARGTGRGASTYRLAGGGVASQFAALVRDLGGDAGLHRGHVRGAAPRVRCGSRHSCASRRTAINGGGSRSTSTPPAGRSGLPVDELRAGRPARPTPRSLPRLLAAVRRRSDERGAAAEGSFTISDLALVAAERRCGARASDPGDPGRGLTPARRASGTGVTQSTQGCQVLTVRNRKPEAPKDDDVRGPGGEPGREEAALAERDEQARDDPVGQAPG